MHYSALILIIYLVFQSVEAAEALSEKMLQIMHQPKYAHSHWGVFVKDTATGQVLYDHHSDQMFFPASTTKLFSTAALLHAYGDDFRFRTPVYAAGAVKNGRLDGNLILVSQGDFTLGGRQEPGTDRISFTKMDHTYANLIPDASLTKEDPLNGLNGLAKQIRDKGLKEINGDVLVDDRLFDITEKRGMILSPSILNDNLIDISLAPGEVGKEAILSWRPMVEGYSVKNIVTTVSNDQPLNIQITSDELGKEIVVKGQLPISQKELLRTFSVKDANAFMRLAFIQALRAQGISVNLASSRLPPERSLKSLRPVALWSSPPLSEYVKLILKVSHNLGADLIPLLLAAQKGKKTFDDGMLEIGHFVTNVAKVPQDAFVFQDGAGGEQNRLTPKAEVHLLEYMHKLPAEQFQKYFNALPIQGVDGSLEDFGKNTPAYSKVYAKTGTGVVFNLATKQFFLIAQVFSGYIEGKNGHLYAYMVAVDNANMPQITDIFPIFEDFAQLSSQIFENTAPKPPSQPS